MEKESIFGLTYTSLQESLVEKSYPKYSATQIFGWLYRHFSRDIHSWTNVSKKVKSFLADTYCFELPKVIEHYTSKDGTRKFLIELDDKQTVEAVLIIAKDRKTLCISSQVGCAIGCIFCHTAKLGFFRNLTAGEIVGEYLAVLLWCHENIAPEVTISNIVYMGMGEPLHNFNNVKDATLIFMEPHGMGIGQRKITLSTSGLVNMIEKLENFPPVNIAISLHSARNSIRSELMPINRVHDLKRLFQAIKKIPLKGHRKVTYEYIVIDEMNNQQEDIDALCALLNKDESKLNLIPFNEYPGSNFRRPSDKNVQEFAQQLNKRGLVTTIRCTKGADIMAACGQLRGQKESKEES